MVLSCAHWLARLTRANSAGSKPWNTTEKGSENSTGKYSVGVLFMYLYTPPFLPIQTSLAYCQASAFNAVILEFSPVWLQMSEPTFLVA